MEETLKDIKSAIERSGFPLEHYIGLVLKQHGWQIITNRNYIDDIKGVEREIDILAYKIYSDKDENIDYVTTLIISCKKSDKYKWCFLTRDVSDECNINFTPFHYCTSDERLSYMTDNHLDLIIDRYKKHRTVKCLYTFNNKVVFAYQELTEASTPNERTQKGNIFTVKNEDIYNSISTTIKAISNEKKGRLEAYDYSERQRYYTFHAISVFEGEMYEAHFDANSMVDVKPISNIKYLNRHIVDGVDDSYIVHFINRDIFDYRLKIFDYMHDENARTLPLYMSEFYKNIFDDIHKVNIFERVCSLDICYHIELHANCGTHRMPTSSSLSMLKFTYKNNLLEIGINDSYYHSDDMLNELNSNEALIKKVGQILQEYYRYSGKFVFTKGLRLY